MATPYVAQGHESTPNPTSDVLSPISSGIFSATDPMGGIFPPSLATNLEPHTPNPEDEEADALFLHHFHDDIDDNNASIQ